MQIPALNPIWNSTWLRVAVLCIVAAAALAVWLTRPSDRPVLAVAHLSYVEMEQLVYAELVAIHGENICSVSGTSTPDAEQHSKSLAAQQDDHYPPDEAIAVLEEEFHSFDQVDDYHVAGPRVAFVAYANTKNERVLYNSGHEVLASLKVLHALSGGSAGVDRWEVVEATGYEFCEPPQ